MQKVAAVNDDPDLNAKAIPAYLQKGKLLPAIYSLFYANAPRPFPVCFKKGKLLPALKSAICLKEKHQGHPKTVATLVKLFKKWLTMTDEEKLEACGGD